MRRAQAGGLTRRIRRHYDLLTPFYYLLWGEHVHHGYWMDREDHARPIVAQNRLIDELYTLAGRPSAPSVLDVGCGYGGGLLWLARNAGAGGVGLTLSPVQRLIARGKIKRARLDRRLRVLVADAQRPWPVDAGSVDLVWCVECTEHLKDRAFFAQQAYRALSPGGVLCVAAWLRSADSSAQAEKRRREVERGMLCYPFDSAQTYCGLFTEAGFEDVRARIVTEHVARTWDIVIALRDTRVMRGFARVLGTDARAFASSFTPLYAAYNEGAMEYGLFVARKPGVE